MPASNRARFFASAATTALVVTLAASGAQAACSTQNSTVTCANVTGENDVNAAVNAVAPPSVDVVVSPGASVTAGAFGAIYPGSTFKGAVALNNSGALGTSDAPVGFYYYGPAGAGADNTVSINNSGVITGGVGVYNTGGDISLQSSGTLADGAVLSAGSSTTTSTATSTTTKVAIANASAKVTGPVGTPASGLTPATPATLYVQATGDASAEVDGLAGYVAVGSGASDSANSLTTATSGDTTTTTATSNTSSVGGNSALTLGADSTVGNVLVASGAGTATASIGGAVGSEDSPANASLVTGATDTATKTVQTHTASATGSSDGYTSHYEATARGGDATADVASTGAVSGNLSVTSGVGTANANVAGQVAGNVSAKSSGARNQTDDWSDGATYNGSGVETAFNYQENYTSSAAGGSASVTVAQGARVNGDVTVAGDASASVDNSGRIDGNVGAISYTSGETAYTDKEAYTYDGSGHGTSDTAYSDTYTDQGGTAAVTNHLGGIIVGDVTANGLGGATFDNEGAAYGNVALTSKGGTTVYTGSSSTVTPAPSTTAATTTSSKTSSSTTYTATGGNVSGTYAGTIGAADNSVGAGLARYTTITQNADGNSDATISGTAYADFFGTAGGKSTSDSSSTDTSWTDTPPVAPATTATRDYSQTTETDHSETYSPSTSSATVTGRLLNNDNGTGNLTLNSLGGDATLTVNGGTITGTSIVNADTAANYDYSQKTVTAGSGDVPTSGNVPAAATQTTTTHTAYTQTGGKASASLANATLGTYSTSGDYLSGGDLYVSGVGAGTGLTAASVTVDAKSKAGVVSVVAGGASSVDDATLVITRDADGKQSGTRSETYGSTNAVGDAVASVAGTVQGLNVSAGAGNATATLTGQSVNGVSVDAGASDYSYQYQATATPASSKTVFNTYYGTPLTADETRTYTAVGGAANLSIDTASTLTAKGVNVVSTGDISVNGLTSASLTVGAGSKLFDNSDYSFSYHNISVEAGGYNDTYVTHADYAAGNYSEHDIYTPVTGTASFSNAGTIGSRKYGEAADVYVFGAGGASGTNSGVLVGDLTVDALDYGTDINTTITNYGDTPTQVNTTVAQYTPIGGTATLANTGLVVGSLYEAAGTGQLTNGGVVEGGIGVGYGIPGYTATTVTTATDSTTTVALPDTLFTQTYTVNQNGLVLGGIGVGGAVVSDPSTVPLNPSGYLKTSNVNATINLNSGSVTLGNITGQTDPLDPTVRLTNTTLNLNGTGYLGIGPNEVLPITTNPDLESVLASVLGVGKGAAYAYSPNYAQFVSFDPGSDGVGTLTGTTLTPGAALGLAETSSRITGVETVDKTGGGTFTILGSAYQSPNVDTPDAQYTMDVGTLKVSNGELQLGVAGSDPVTGASIFGIRGNVDVDGGTLTLGRTITYGGNSVILGTNVLIDGKLDESASGTLALGATPTLMRQFGTLVLPSQAQGLLGYGQYGVTLSPFVPYGEQYIGLASTPSTISVTGDVSLAGTIKVAATPGALYLAGRDYDVLTVDGTFSSTATVTSNLSSPFVSFTLTPRTENGETIVSLDVVRTPYSSVTSTKNAAAAADALDAAMPNVVTALSSLTSPQAVTNVQAYGNQQDLATVMAALDSSLTPAQATEALNELGTGSFYGSLSAISTTAAFGDVPDALSGQDRGIGLWFRPTGSFAHYNGSSTTGAAPLHVSNYGGSIGFNLLTGRNGYFGFAGGYSHTRAHDIDSPEDARADTYMAGFYGAQSWDRLHVNGQAVFGWSNWKTDRELPIFDRTANAKFDSKEFRLTLQASYDFALGRDVVASPFAEINLRHYKFDGFDEQNAGGIGLHVDGKSKTVFNPEIGARITGKFGAGKTVQPYAQASYVFQSHVGSDRTVSYLGDPSTDFQLRGVNPKGYANLGAGLQADLGIATFFAGGNYLTGGHQHAGEVKGGLLVKF